MFARMLQSLHPGAAGIPVLFIKHSRLARGAMVVLALLAAPLFAQPDLPVTQLLFEPVPIPATGAGGNENLTTLANMPSLVSSAAIEERRLDGAQRLEILANIEEYVAAIGNKEASEGPYSDQLVQDLFSTGLMYQQLEDHEQAIDFFNRAQNISRVNEGLDTIAQAPIIKAKTESLLALDRIRDADDAQEGLLQIYRDSYGEGSVELVPALRDLGDWNLQAFLARSNIALISQRMNVQNFMTQSAQTGGTPADLLFNQNMDTTSQPIYKLFIARNNYFDAINILLQEKNYTHPDLLDLERKLQTASFLRTHQENIVYEPDFYLERKTTATGTRLDTSSQNVMNSSDYDVGLQSLQRSLFYISSNPERSHDQVASAMIAEADWHMLFERKVVGRRKYEEIYEFFAENPDFGEFAGDIIYPDLPVVLPTFLPAPNSREKLGIAPNADVNYFGYFDVSFSINRTGKARKIKVSGKGGEVTRNMEMRLNEYLRKALFRPRYDREGKLDEEELRLRYYVGV